MESSNLNAGAGLTKLNWRTWIVQILVVGVMPFLYGAATRLPFIYFVIHLDIHFNLDWRTIGFYVASYQGSRVLTSALAVFFPKASHLLGTAAGLAGYITVYVSDKNLITPFAIGTAIIGFSETMSSMQKYIKEMYKLDSDQKKTKRMLRYQYACVMLGVVFAFSIGGFVYQYQSIDGVALFGIIIEALAMVAFFVFFGLTSHGPLSATRTDAKLSPPTKNITEEVQPLEESNENKGHANVTQEECETERTAGSVSEINWDEEGQSERSNPIEKAPTLKDTPGNIRLSCLLGIANKEYSTSDLPTTWVNWLICVSFGIEALTIGYNLSIGPIFLLNEFHRGTGIIGVLFAVGAASGSFAAIGLTCTAFGKKLLRHVASSPFDLCFAVGGIAIGVLVAAIPNFVAHVFGLILLMCFNDLGATLMTELQGSITTVSNYSLLGPMGQVVRRSMNVVTALSGPVLYGVFPRLPYIVAGVITLFWTMLLFVAFKFRMVKTVEAISDKTGESKNSVKDRMSFCTAEVVHSMLAILEESTDDSDISISC